MALAVVPGAIAVALGAYFGLGFLGARFFVRRILRETLETAHKLGRCPVCGRPIEHQGDVPPL